VGNAQLPEKFSLVQKCLSTNNLQRRRILESIILIHNFRTELVGYSEFQSVFDPEYKRSITPEGCDQIANYYLQLGDYATDDELDGDKH
jgi:hypothetical protein